MAVSLASLKRGRNVRPPRIVIYGPHGLGKSSFGASAPAPVFIQTEDGLGTLDVTSFPLAQTFADVNGALSTLYTDDHEFSTVVIDSADWLEPLIWKETCALHGKADIEEFGYGKGYGFALDQWRSVLSGLNALRDTKNMASIVTAHCQIKRSTHPRSSPTTATRRSCITRPPRCCRSGPTRCSSPTGKPSSRRRTSASTRRWRAASPPGNG